MLTKGADVKELFVRPELVISTVGLGKVQRYNVPSLAAQTGRVVGGVLVFTRLPAFIVLPTDRDPDTVILPVKVEGPYTCKSPSTTVLPDRVRPVIHYKTCDF